MGSLTAAADGSHLRGAMIALMPTPEDAARLAIDGGEAAEELHCTLCYLGKGGAFDEEAQALIVEAVRTLAEGMPLVRSNIFGAAHWNATSDEPSWVWSVGDDPEQGTSLEAAHEMAHEALLMSAADVEIPEQHTPWVAHICAAYSGDPALLPELEARLGPVTFDRVRVAFAGDHTDIPLATGMTAAAGPLRRQPTDLELASRADFADMNDAWHKAVDDTVKAWAAIQSAQRAEIAAAVQTAIDSGDIDQLDTLTVSTTDATNLLYGRMQTYAQQAGQAQQREAEAQGVDVPEWTLDDQALTAAAVRDRLRQVAVATARLLGGGLVQSALRQAMRLFGSGSGQQIAAQVDAHLRGLSDASVEEALGGAMSAAQNEGRMAVLSAAPPATYVATEILDRNSCKPCRQIDGTRYHSLGAARRVYPSGGYTGCLGGPRCRGTVVAVWRQEPERRESAGAISAAAGATMQQTTDEGGTVPYSIVQDHPDCGADTPWAVVKEGDGEQELMGCHATEDDAKAQQAALYAQEGDIAPDDEGMDMSGATAPWEGVLAVEGIVTGDGREFAPDALTWADLPIPLRWNKEDSHGGEPHTVAVNVGRIDRVWRDGDKIKGAGVLNLAEPDGQRAHDLIKGEFLRGVSIDADSIGDADVEFVWPDEVSEGMDAEADDDLFEMLFAQPEKVIFHGGRIRAATLVDIPAFAEAYVALLDSSGAVVAGGQPVGEAALAPPPAVVSEPTRSDSAMTAAGDLVWRAPSAWFADPALSLPTPITITDEGRIYGHAAQWGTCHIGQEGTCIQPPHEAEHAYYRTGEVVCADGARVAVGQITVGTGHAPLNLGAAPAAEHYDNTGAAVADVAVGNDAHGIWVAGAIRPGADPLKVYELQAAGQVSGDWRRIGGQLRLVGLLAVNVPGFPVPKMRARVASGQPQALVAAGRPQVAWGRSQADMEREAVRIVMGMLSRRVHEGR
jgi:hypothetical protein